MKFALVTITRTKTAARTPLFQQPGPDARLARAEDIEAEDGTEAAMDAVDSGAAAWGLPSPARDCATCGQPMTGDKSGPHCGCDCACGAPGHAPLHAHLGFSSYEAMEARDRARAVLARGRRTPACDASRLPGGAR